jgi:hypothetical protein
MEGIPVAKIGVGLDIIKLDAVAGIDTVSGMLGAIILVA